MKFAAHILCLLSLMAFATSTVAHSASSVAMASAMITADAIASADEDCAVCDDQGAGLDATVCSFVCNVAGLTAIEARLEHGFSVFASAVRAPIAEQQMHGISGPPATQPPRSISDLTHGA